jgi:hypothetical protein
LLGAVQDGTLAEGLDGVSVVGFGRGTAAEESVPAQQSVAAMR